MNVAARNSPCPCGSGKRYKECHGAFNSSAGSRVPLLEPSQQTELVKLMREALALQQEGRLADAIAKYEVVVAQQPGNFDALHMLGVAWFQSNKLDRAADYVDRALTIRPDVIAAQSNRKLIDDARQLMAMEAMLCREVLPQLSALCRWNLPNWLCGESQALDLVVAARALDADDLRIVKRIVGDPRFRTVTWQTRLSGAVSNLKTITDVHEVDSAPGPVSEFMIVYGFDIPAAAWIRGRVPAHVAIVVNTDLPCQLLDRIRELSDQGRSTIGIIFNRAELKAASGLPGLLLEEWFAATPIQ
jgi:tetratricopeptide (TPR) repeat protein